MQVLCCTPIFHAIETRGTLDMHDMNGHMHVTYLHVHLNTRGMIDVH